MVACGIEGLVVSLTERLVQSYGEFGPVQAGSQQHKEDTMARAEKVRAVEGKMRYRGLREWLEEGDRAGELLKINGAHWDREMGSITQMLTESSKGKAPAILFDEVPGYPKGFRTLYGQFSSIKRVALTLGLPLEYERKVDIVKAYHERMQNLALVKPKVVKKGPILDHEIG